MDHSFSTGGTIIQNGIALRRRALTRQDTNSFTTTVQLYSQILPKRRTFSIGIVITSQLIKCQAAMEKTTRHNERLPEMRTSYVTK